MIGFTKLPFASQREKFLSSTHQHFSLSFFEGCLNGRAGPKSPFKRSDIRLYAHPLLNTRMKLRLLGLYRHNLNPDPTPAHILLKKIRASQKEKNRNTKINIIKRSVY